MKNCSIRGCEGKYEDKIISRMLTHKKEQVVLENIPAEVCDICGDTLISLNTSAAIEKILKNLNDPINTLPVYELPGLKAVKTDLGMSF
ncbi:MAG: YgiT-type zinc finger protein [Desulfobacterales bacterium]|nr:YgiT-type zinc finger protein [Desulfobacterales bacterium]